MGRKDAEKLSWVSVTSVALLVSFTITANVVVQAVHALVRIHYCHTDELFPALPLVLPTPPHTHSSPCANLSPSMLPSTQIPLHRTMSLRRALINQAMRNRMKDPNEQGYDRVSTEDL